MNICIIGTGHVGLVTGACFAEIGNKVICIDNNASKIDMLKKGRMPIYEPGSEKLVKDNLAKGRLFFSVDIAEGVKTSEIIFICVSTPRRPDGGADLSFVEQASREVALTMRDYRLIVGKSTIPVRTSERISYTIETNNPYKVKFDIASNPEFLSEGRAVEDFMHPDRIVIGVSSGRAEELLRKLYQPIKAPIVVTDIKSAELIKHASNSFLATKISFINAISQICERTGADVEKVAEGMGLDKRIGKPFLGTGIGYGGACFPKDIDAFIKIAKDAGYEFRLLDIVREINKEQKEYFVRKVKDTLWNVKDKRIAVLGLSFKPHTDDMRLAPSIDIIKALQAEGALICAYDPQAMKEAEKYLDGIELAEDAYSAMSGSDCLLILTEWDEFKELDLKKVKDLLRQPIIIDGRNIYEPAMLKEVGFRYISVGRPAV